MITEPVIRQFDYLSIRPSYREVAETMGYKEGSEPSFLEEAVDIIIKEASNNTEASGCFGIFRVSTIDSGVIRLSNNSEINCGSMIARRLSGSEYLAMLLVTAGSRFENWNRSYRDRGDALSEFICSSIGSVIADKAADVLEEDIKIIANKSGLQITARYSPGYCDWPVNEQKIIFRHLPAGKTGVTLNSSFLMSPVKSVSGIAGIGKDVSSVPYECDVCSQEDCIIRKAREK